MYKEIYLFEKGTTNEIERNKQFRRPVFLVSKDFVKGLELKPGVCIDGSITQLNHAAQNGKIPQVKLNFSEIADIAKVSNDVAKTCIDRTLRELNLRVKNVKKCYFLHQQYEFGWL
mgnify:FL=1